MKRHPQSSKGSKAWSLVDTLTSLAIAGVLAAIAYPTIQISRKQVQETKLSSEITTLNTAVKSFISSGGEILPEDSALDVLEKLKQRVSEEDRDSYVGFTGAHLDHRLTPVGIDSETPGMRVVWNHGSQRFETTNDLVEGIAAFVMDDSLDRSAAVRETDAIVEYANDDKGWVWTYGEPAPKQLVAPTPIETDPNGGDGQLDPIPISLISPPNPLPDPDPVNPPLWQDPGQLQPPVFTIAGGHYALRHYKLDLELLNPNTQVESRIFFRYGQGARWHEYVEGTVLETTPDTEIDAFVFSFDPNEYRSSSLASSAYRSTPVPLELDLRVDRNEVGYFDLLDDEVMVRMEVANLDAYPEYMKTAGFFTHYWTMDSSDPAFPANRIPGERYAADYSGQSIPLYPAMWADNEILEITAYAESLDTTWIQHSEKPSVVITARRDALPAPRIDLQEIEDGLFHVTMTATGEMPDGAEIYYNMEGRSMVFDPDTGEVERGTVYEGPFLWQPEEVEEEEEEQSDTSGLVNIDSGDGDVPILQVVLRTDGELVVQNESVPYEAMVRPGANSMRDADVIDKSSNEIRLESITINDNGRIIVADHVNVLEVTVSNLNYPNGNLSKIQAYENGEKVGQADQDGFDEKIQQVLSSTDLRDYIRYDGNNNFLGNTSWDFDVSFSPLTNEDYLVVMERYGNSTFDLKPLDASGEVIPGSNNVVIREYSWNTGYAPSDYKSQPLFFTVVDVEQFGVDTVLNSIKGFRVNNDGGADFKFFTISDESFEDRSINYAGDLTAAAYPPADLKNWFQPSRLVSRSVEGYVEDPKYVEPEYVDINFRKLTTSAGFLNEGYLVVNGVEHKFLTSDDPMGGSLDLTVLVDEATINTIDLKIYTPPRVWMNGQQVPSYDRKLNYHSAIDGLIEIDHWQSFGGQANSAAKVKNRFEGGNRILEFAFEDLMDFDPYGWLDWDYNDYNFDIKMPDWVNFQFGGILFEGVDA